MGGYYRILSLAREPFSNSPDPGLFYNSHRHLEALQKLEISIRLKRGLSVITGEVGTGKTTLSRQLIQRLSQDEAVRTVLLLDPGFPTVRGFLSYLLLLLTGSSPGRGTPEPEKGDTLDEIALKEKIKTHLFNQSVDGESITVLLIDEGQKLSVDCLEVLRELLNYESNDHKLLQIVIFAQKEFEFLLEHMENFRDRINFRYALGPLNFRETCGLIQYRLDQSFEPGKARPLFSKAAFWAIYRTSLGFPRKIVNLCHHVILAMLIKNRKQAGFFLVRSVVDQVVLKKKRRKGPAFAFLVLLILFPLLGWHFEPWSTFDRAPQVLFPVEVEIPVPASRSSTTLAQAQDHGQAQPQVQTQVQVEETTPPILLGRLRIQRDETLCFILENIYGLCRNAIVQEVMAANPKLTSPDRIMAGTIINIPVPTFEIQAGSWPGVVLELAQESDLKKAYTLVRDWKENGHFVRILPTWSKSRGRVFYVVLDRIFDTTGEATAFAENFLAHLKLKPVTLASWGDITRVYTRRM